MTSLNERLESVRARIAAAARRAGRRPEEVRLVAVSKTRPPERVAEAIHAGVEIIGENRVQEARDKRLAMDPALAGRAQWHLIGSLQRNKARQVIGLFDMVETVDSLPLAEELARRAEASGAAPLRVLLQVNTGEESQKGGAAPAALPGLLEGASRLEALRVEGLMCIPPLGRAPEESRPHFRLLRKLRDEAQGRGFASLRELSMGMSGDFELAIEEGATFVRIGTAIFGPRPPR
ncbi:MAG: YggS family pyridoxal phosphate-dependent enzyme [Candidatus Tectomicrobia bacterium]|uniref:Pyridoxal phosphate homeostasis protein n=1 Tax=Tectimicrobiota bacterium TaxID=2528274 RepID=A0A932I064_UNCTE|nr:YggS family pyridoxal phosphate-dependent enzyme [Candidatus Tectomicrobia bacterium]